MKKLTLDEVKNIVIKIGLIPKFTEYINSKQQLLVECPIHGEFITNYKKLKRVLDYNKGNGCRKCSAKNTSSKRILSLKEAQDIVRQLGHEPLFTEYINSTTKIKCKCKEHGEFFTTISLLKKCIKINKGNGCKKCLYESNANKKRLTLEEAKDIIIELGHIPLFDKYINNDTPVLVKCKKHGIFFITIGDAKKKLKNKNGNGCKECRDEKRRFLTKEERIRKRKEPQYNKWRKSVYKRDNYICQKCGCKSTKSNKLNAHHIENYSENCKKRYDINNGISLCFKCHIDFHKKYGTNHNNIKQINEFLNNGEK